MEIKVHTKYDYAAIRDMQRNTLTRGGRKYLLTVLLVLLTIMVCFTFIEISLGLYDSLAYSLLVIIFILFYLFFLWSLFPKMSFNKLNVHVRNALVCYTFGGNNFDVTETTANSTANRHSTYDIIQKVFETKNYFYIYISTIHIHIVSKAGFDQGTEEDLRMLLVEKVGDKKYKRVK